jgi:hypothetical protein
VKAGDIWLAQLDPTVGSEIQKTRPCVAHIPHIEFVNRPEFPSHGGGWRQVLST